MDLESDHCDGLEGVCYGLDPVTVLCDGIWGVTWSKEILFESCVLAEILLTK